MAKLHRITLNGQTLLARSGTRLLDAALAGGIDMPHDCRAGRCGACLTRIVSGITLGGETCQPGSVHACQAMVFSDLAIDLEPLPPVTRIRAHVAGIAEVGEDIAEVTLALAGGLEMRPGQFCRFRFGSLPWRPFSPTAAMASVSDDRHLRLHIKRVRDGRVTPEIGRGIKTGHRVAIEGPFGHAFLRPGLDSRLVLVGSGTGFAPVWAVAVAALRENPRRSIILLGASRRLAAFYMAPALELARRYPGVGILPVVEEPASYPGLLGGRAIDHLPRLCASDIVYAAGAPLLVEAVARKAVAAGAQFHADPFEASAPRGPSLLESARTWLAGV